MTVGGIYRPYTSHRFSTAFDPPYEILKHAVKEISYDIVKKTGEMSLCLYSEAAVEAYRFCNSESKHSIKIEHMEGRSEEEDGSTIVSLDDVSVYSANIASSYISTDPLMLSAKFNFGSYNIL